MELAPLEPVDGSCSPSTAAVVGSFVTDSPSTLACSPPRVVTGRGAVGSTMVCDVVVVACVVGVVGCDELGTLDEPGTLDDGTLEDGATLEEGATLDDGATLDAGATLDDDGTLDDGATLDAGATLDDDGTLDDDVLELELDEGVAPARSAPATARRRPPLRTSARRRRFRFGSLVFFVIGVAFLGMSPATRVNNI